MQDLLIASCVLFKGNSALLTHILHVYFFHVLVPGHDFHGEKVTILYQINPDGLQKSSEKRYPSLNRQRDRFVKKN